MHNESIDTLLLRHYGSAAPVPKLLEERLVAAVRAEAREIQHRQIVPNRVRTRQISRRQLIRFVALGSAGAGVLSIGLEGLRNMERGLLGGDTSQPAMSS